MQYLEILKVSRENTLALIENLSTEQLNLIPEKFNNNLIWNLGHLVVTQQLLCYKLSGLDCAVSEDLIQRYRKGTAPEQDASKEEITLIKQLALSLIESTHQDLKEGVFKNYTPYMTSFRVELTSIEEALSFNNVHETMHYGYMRALYKLVH